VNHLGRHDRRGAVGRCRGPGPRTELGVGASRCRAHEVQAAGGAVTVKVTNWREADLVELQVGESGRCQTKFYTACLRAGTRWSSTVFAHELSPRAASFEPENGLYTFALTMPSEEFGPCQLRAAIVLGIRSDDVQAALGGKRLDLLTGALGVLILARGSEVGSGVHNETARVRFGWFIFDGSF
jgi:hypothetical protein